MTRWLVVALLAVFQLAAPEISFAADEPVADDLFADEDDDLEVLFGDEPEDSPAVGAEYEQPVSVDVPAAEPDTVTTREPAAEEIEEVFEDALIDATASGGSPSADTEEILIVGQAAQGIEDAETTSAVNFDADDLRMEQIQDISDLSNLTPNLEIKTAFAATNPTLFIRGIGLDDYNANSASAVAVYQDGVYMNSPVGQLFQLFDVEAVDVLLGPQARLRNANAGAIQIHSNQPTDEFTGHAEVTYGRFNRVSMTGALNLPLAPEVASLRTSFVVNKGGGITKNRCHDRNGTPTLPSGELNVCVAAPPNLDKYVNDTDNWAARSLLRITPEVVGWEAPEFLINVHGGENDSLAAQFQHRGFTRRNNAFPLEPGRDNFNYQDTDDDPFKGDYNAGGKEKISLLGGSVRATWQATDSLEIVSLSAAEWHKRNTFSNDDASPRVVFDHFRYKDHAWQFSQELTLHWLLGDATELDVSGLFLMEDLDVDNTFPNERVGSRMPLIEQEFSQDTRGVAFFAHGRVDLAELDGVPEALSDFALEGTVRYGYEFKRFDLVANATLFRQGNPVPRPQLDERVSESWHGASGDLRLNYYLGRLFDNEDVSIYAKYSRGFKPGHFNGGTTFAAQLVEPVDEETVDAFEIGLRSSWFDGRLDLDLTAFYYIFKDMQIFQLQQEAIGVPLPRLINAKEVQNRGVELELRAEPIEFLELQLNAGWLKAEYEDFVTFIVQGRGLQQEPERIVVDYSGNQLLAAPEFSASGSIHYTLETRFGSLRPRYSFSVRDDVFFDPNEGAGARGNLKRGTIGQRAYWVHNAALTYTTPQGTIEVTGWVRNFTDEAYRVQSFDLTEQNFQFALDAYGDPITYGLTAVLRF